MNGIGQTMQPDLSMMVRALGLLAPDSVIELRALTQRGRKRTDAGYFDVSHHAGAAREAESLNASGAAVYVTLNPVDPQLLGRYSNRIEKFAQATTTDANIVRRAWLLLDFDPVRPKDTSATDAQLEQARELTRKAFSLLKGRGWPDPVVAESGNGMHLLYSLDLPNTPEVTEAVKAVLNALADKLDTAEVKVDRSVFNASRIGKLYGTIANKGDNTPATPWRLSRIVKSPEHADVVTLGQLRELVAEIAPTVEPLKTAIAEVRPGQRADFDLDSFLSRLGIETTRDLHNGRDRYKLANCPFNPEHGFGEAAIFRGSDGTLGFKCQHSTCADQHWQDVRALVDGPKELRRGPQAGAGALAGMTHQSKPADAQRDVEPEPLRATLSPAKPYPVDALGDVLGGAAKALNDAVKAPLALCAQSVLAAASLAVQGHFDVKLPWGERKPTSLFCLTVGESGERKSGIDDLVLGAAKAEEKKLNDVYIVEMQAYEIQLNAWKQATDSASKAATKGVKAKTADVQDAILRCGEKPVPPVQPLRFVTDPTVEGLYKLLVSAQPSVALFSDEGGLLIGGHALNSDNALKTFSRWCKLWDGSPFDRVRAGDGAGILYGRRMALHQLAQPDVMVKLLSDPMANGQGLLSRCLPAWPQSTIGTRHVERYEWAGGRPEMQRLFAVLKKLLETKPRTGKIEQELDPIELPLSSEATALSVAAGNQFESMMKSGGVLAELRDRTSKALENACRIAAILAVIKGGLEVREIDETHLKPALVLIQWYLSEALRIRGAAAIPRSVSDAEQLSAWLKDNNLRMFRSKQVLNLGPNPIRNKPRFMAAIAELVAGGYLTENPPGTVVGEVKARKSWTVVHHVV